MLPAAAARGHRGEERYLLKRQHGAAQPRNKCRALRGGQSGRQQRVAPMRARIERHIEASAAHSLGSGHQRLQHALAAFECIVVLLHR